MWRIIIGILDPQLVVVFGEITESLGGEALLEKVPHLEQACRIYSLTPFLSYVDGKCVQSISCSNQSDLPSSHDVPYPFGTIS